MCMTMLLLLNLEQTTVWIDRCVFVIDGVVSHQTVYIDCSNFNCGGEDCFQVSHITRYPTLNGRTNFLPLRKQIPSTRQSHSTQHAPPLVNIRITGKRGALPPSHDFETKAVVERKYIK